MTSPSLFTPGEARREHGVRQTRKRLLGIEPHTSYQTDPVRWAVDKLGVNEASLRWSLNPGYQSHEWDGTKDPMAQALESIAAGQHVAVESGTGTGKTYTAAIAVLWFLACFLNSLVVTIAPIRDQLLLHVWKEIGRFWPRFQRWFPTAVYTSGKIRMLGKGKEHWAATAFTAGVGAEEVSSVRTQGWHAKHMLFLLEECPDIHPAMLTAIENTCVSPTTNLRLAIGNPDSQADGLHLLALRDSVTAYRASALDHPNVVLRDPDVIAGAVTFESIEQRKELYLASPAMYDSRIRGICPPIAQGVALVIKRPEHFDPRPLENLRQLSEQLEWTHVCGIDFGWYRFAFLHVVIDHLGRGSCVTEYFSQCEGARERALWIHQRLTAWKAPKSTRIYGDSANPQDIHELNKVLKEIDSPYRVRAVVKAKADRPATVMLLRHLLATSRLRFTDVGEHDDWREGWSAVNQGIPRKGSRLLWELQRWRYPKVRDDRAQPQDPDDNSADGGDMIAALRYLVLGYWQPGKEPEEEAAKPSRNVDTSIDAFADRMKKHYAEMWEAPL